MRKTISLDLDGSYQLVAIVKHKIGLTRMSNLNFLFGFLDHQASDARSEIIPFEYNNPCILENCGMRNGRKNRVVFVGAL